MHLQYPETKVICLESKNDFDDIVLPLGWVLLEVIYCDKIADTHKEVLNDNGYGTRRLLDGQLVRRVPYALIGRTESAALEARVAELDAASVRLDALASDLGYVRRENEALETKAQELEKKLKRSDDNEKRICQDLNRERLAKGKLEGDIAKLRKALGELRMKEILNTPPI